MSEKSIPKQRRGLRAPRQDRARQKVELILEAAIRLLERDGLPGLTTNAIADLAGVSIGTLYQYFSDKEMILDALADREIGIMGTRIRQIMADPALNSPEVRVQAIVEAVAAGYSDRRGAHRIVMEHSLKHGGGRASPLLADLVGSLSHHGSVGTVRQPLASADAFVLIYAFAGVLRAMTRQADAPSRPEIEAGLVRLVASFIR